jgi:hypothetical protein
MNNCICGACAASRWHGHQGLYKCTELKTIVNTSKQPEENIMFGFIADAVTSPLVDAFDVLEGLTEGELRTKAALRLGADVVAGMAVSEVIEALKYS